MIIVDFMAVLLCRTFLPRNEGEVSFADVFVGHEDSFVVEGEFDLDYEDSVGVDHLPLLETSLKKRVEVENAFYLVGTAASYVAPSLALLQRHIALGAEDVEQFFIVLHQHFE